MGWLLNSLAQKMGWIEIFFFTLLGCTKYLFQDKRSFFVLFTATYIFYLTERDALNISTINDDFDELPGNLTPTRFLW